MTSVPSLEMLAFNLKLLGTKTRKRVLLSAGKLEDKKRMLPAIRRLSKLDIDLHATPGTHAFLEENGVQSVETHKITDGRAPNILTLLQEGRFDLVVNVLTGDQDYDEASDAKLIRKLSIENGIPLFTEVELAIAKLDQVRRDFESG